MEVNKDEAIRCLDLAEQYFTSGDTEKAYKFAKKSEKLFSTKRANDLLDRIMQRKKQSEPTTSAPKDATDHSQTSSKPAERAVVAEYTKEQLIQVQRIKKCKDYYEILGVAKEATDVEIKKAYKRLALQLHPDKNRAPGSSEAFKAIGNAVAILTDSDKRRKYDLHGNNDDERVTHRNNRTYEYTRGFESDVSAEELFNMFFGNGFASSNHVFMRRSHHQRRARYSDEQTQEQSASQVVIQLLPIIFLLLVSVFSGIFQSDPIYSLTKNSKYSEQHYTTNLKIAYFVPRNFAKTYTGSKDELDKAVEDDFLSYLKHACYREINERDQLRWKARYFGDKRLYEKANSLATPSCTEFQKYTGIHLR